MDIEIIRKIEILCFLEIDKIKDFKKTILEKLSKEDKYKSFINYLKDYIFKMNPLQYNYNKLIEYSQERNQTKFIEKIYTINNICESLNSKLNYNLPKTSTTNYSFINSITKVLINEKQKLQNKSNIIRSDYITRTFIKFIDDNDFNNNMHWISYKEFIKYEEIIIKNLNNDVLEEDTDKYINY